MPELTESEKAIFRVAVSLTDTSERNKFLRQACGSNEQLIQQLERLLAADESPDRLLGPPAVLDSTDDAACLSTRSQQIGRYKLLQKIGEGSFGVVYMAEQQEPIVRKVALKIIRLGMDNKQVVARFEAERQALAMMDHPNIAKVLDAGATEAGLPYFVMELVRGVPLIQHCDQQKLTIEDRLRLFINVCGAIQHAHQKGIIHRDIKPTNILVTLVDGQLVPKVIDFGIAKATLQRLTDKTLFTRFEQFIGTPTYMSPEQAETGVVDVDTRSDIYSLGVVLYEFLTGTTPLETERLRATPYSETLRLIREYEAPTPSTRLSTLGDRIAQVAEQRGVDPPKLQQELHGDLDWIVIKALEKDRTRRYSTAMDLARDVQKYLDGEAIEARPPSTAYRLSKFARKQRRLLTSMATITLVLIIGTAVSIWQAVRATSALENSQRSRAELALDKGQLLGEQGNANLAMLWMARSLKLAPANATRLRNVIRKNLGGWRTQICPLRLVMPHEGRADAVAVSPDGTVLVTAARLENQGVLVWRGSAHDGQSIGNPIKHLTGMVLSLGFSPAGDTLALGYADGRVELLDTTTGAVTALPKQQGYVTCVVVSPDAKWLLVAYGEIPLEEDEYLDESTGSIRGTCFVQLLDMRSGAPQLDAPLKHESTVWTAAFSAADPPTVVTHAGPWIHPKSKGVIRFWNLRGKEIREPLEVPSPALRIAISSDGTRLLTGHGGDYSAHLWDLDEDHINHAKRFPCSGPVSVVAFAPDESGRILTADFAGAVRLWDIATGHAMSPSLWHDRIVRSAIFSSDGNRVLTGAGGVTRLWATSRETVDTSSATYTPPRFPLAFSPDWRTFMTQDDDGLATLREASTGRIVGGPVRIKTPLMCGAFSADHKYAATIGVDQQAQLWNLISGECVTQLQYGDEPAHCTSFSPDGSSVAVGFSGAVANVWQVGANSPTLVLKHRLHSGPVFSIDYNSSGDLILTGGADSFARLWDASTGEEAGGFRHDPSCSAAFSPDGSLVVTVGTDHNARVWDVRLQRQLGPPLTHLGAVTTAVFSRDGQTILTGSVDQTARLWDVASGKQLGPSMKHAGYVNRVGYGPANTVLTSAGSYVIVSSPPGPTRSWIVPTAPEGTDDQIELWTEVMTGMVLDENGGARVLGGSNLQERASRLRQSGFVLHRTRRR